MINPMKKVLLAARTEDRSKVLEIIRVAEVVHVEPVDRTQVSVPVTVNDSLEQCHKAISRLAQIPVDCSEKLATPGTPTRLVEETLQLEQAIADSSEIISELTRELEDVARWGNLGLKDIEWLEKNGLKFVFLRGPLSMADAIDAESFALVKSEDANGLFVAVSRTEVRAPVEFAVVERPARELEQIESEISSQRKAVADREHALHCLALRLSDVENHYKKLLNRKRYAEVESGVLNAEEIFVLTGWLPADKTATLEAIFETEGVAVGIDFSDPGEDEIPPTTLKNPIWAQSIQPLYDFMGVVPSYNEPDASGLFLAMLTIFSAFLMADAGYGLLVMVALLAAYKPLVQRGADRNFLHLGMFLFGGTTIYGLLTNTWFGETYQLFNSYNFDPNSNDGMIQLQGLCFMMGAMHLTVAHIWKAARRKLDVSVLGDIGWICFLWGMYGVICSLILKQEFVMPWSWVAPLFKISAVLILFFTAPSWNIFKSVGAGVGAILQNASNCFSDIVSYIRLWAVGLAGGKVAMAFNDIAAMLPSFFLRLPIWIIGHGINIILGVIAILAHGVRLNLLEFSNHLELEWSGRKYDPFKEIK